MPPVYMASTPSHSSLLCGHLQDAVSAGGPLLAILGFLILPLVWSVPEALITAELATTFPENSGYVAWVTAAFGPFWGFQVPTAPPFCCLALHDCNTFQAHAWRCLVVCHGAFDSLCVLCSAIRSVPL